MTAPSSRVSLPTFRAWGHRIVRWSLAALLATGLLALLSNQLFLGHEASGKSVEWLQALAWAIPTLLAWCACLPLVIRLAARRPLGAPVRAAHVAIHLVAGFATCGMLLGLHLAISWMFGWIPRDTAILPFELAMTGRAYGALNLLAYWGIVVSVGVRRPSAPTPGTPHGPQEIADPFVVKIGSRTLLVPVNDVRWVEAAGNYVRLHTHDRTHLLRTSLKTLADRLDSRDFVRIHRSVIVRQSAVRELKPRVAGDYDVTLTDGTVVTMSRRFRAAAMPRLTDARG